MRDHREDVVMQAYAMVGRVAADFATLEFHLQFVTSILISGKMLSLEAIILTKRHTFSDRIQTIREFTPMRFNRENPLRERFTSLADELDALREKRNLFIHGYWTINWPLIHSKGMIHCSDPKWRFNKKTEEWKTMGSHGIRLEDLENLVYKISATMTEVHDLLKHLEKGQERGPSEG